MAKRKGTMESSIIAISKAIYKMKNEIKNYEVGVEVKPNPSKKPNTIKYVCYEVKATSEENAKIKASDLCSEEFGHSPWTTEII